MKRMIQWINTGEMKERREYHWTKLMLLGACCMLLAANATAASIKAVSLTHAKDGDVVRVVSDAPVQYQVFDLDAPARMVLNFPGVKLGKGVDPVRSDGQGVNSVFPVQNKDGVRLEVGMGQKLGYKVEERGNTLIVKFEAVPDAGAAASEQAAQLKDILVRDRGSVTELILRGDNMDASQNAFVTNQGRTMILDFWGATSKLPKEHYAYSTQKVSGVTVGKAEGRVRLVVDLVPGADIKHQIDASSQQVAVRFGNVAPKRRAGTVIVEGVAFQPDDRVAHLVIRTDVTNPVVSLSEKADHVIVDIKKAALAAGQERSQDVRAFPGPVKQVDSYSIDDNVRIVARLRGKVAVSSYQHGNVLTVNLEPEDLARARTGVAGEEEFAYTGQKVTFDFKDIDIRNALKLISEMSDLNIIMSDDVSGMLTMRLVDVPWDQALDLILAARGLGKDQTGNVLRIAPIEILRDEYQSKLEAQQGSEKLEPLITEFITLSFTRVEDVKKMLEGASGSETTGGKKTATTAASGGATGTAGEQETSIGILSPRGSFLVDERTNTLIVKDTEKSVNNIKRLIAVIDKPVEQVLIEARIVEATDDFTRELGVRWGGVANSVSPDIDVGGAQGSGNPLDADAPNIGTTDRGFLVDLPAAAGAGAGGAIGLSYGILGGAVRLDLELSAAEAENKVKIISNPRVVTTNLKQAVIDQGTDIPFTSVSQNGTQVQFRRATLGLAVTPQITADDRVILHVVVTKDSPSAATVGDNPIISTKKIDTEIFMDNGETVVIGGIYSRDRTNKINGVPLLMDIPILGYLFKKKLIEDKRQELLIFMTPTVMKNTPTAATAQAGRL